MVVCLVLAGLAGYAWYRSEHPSEGAAPNGAITSATARDAGMQAAAKLTQQVLSYDWKTIDDDTKSAEAVLAPSFRTEYAKTMAGVKDQTIKNQVKLTASRSVHLDRLRHRAQGRRPGLPQPGDDRQDHDEPARRQQPGVGHPDTR